MGARTSTLRTIPIVEAERNFRKVLKVVDRLGFVQLTENGKAHYHIGREESETKLLARLEASRQEHREGKTKVLRSLADLWSLRMVRPIREIYYSSQFARAYKKLPLTLQR